MKKFRIPRKAKKYLKSINKFDIDIIKKMPPVKWHIKIIKDLKYGTNKRTA